MLVKIKHAIKSDCHWTIFDGVKRIGYHEDFDPKMLMNYYKYHKLSKEEMTTYSFVDVGSSGVRKEALMFLWISYPGAFSPIAVVFNTTAYLLNDDGKTIDVIRPREDPMKKIVHVFDEIK